MNFKTICFAFLLASLTASAQTPPPSPSDAVKRAVIERTRAFLEGDSDTYQRYTADTFLRTGINGSSHICAATLLERIPREEVFFDILNLKILVTADIAEVSYRLVQFESREEGAPYFMTRRTETFVRTAGGWKLIVERETEIPDRLY